jgi:hypothetical protein
VYAHHLLHMLYVSIGVAARPGHAALIV